MKKNKQCVCWGLTVLASMMYGSFAYAQSEESKTDSEPSKNIDDKTGENNNKKLNEVNNLKKLSEKGFEEG